MSTKYLIDCFDGDYAFLSNFYNAPVIFNGIKFKNSEAAFQAQKCVNREDCAKFADLEAGKAKRLGRRIELRPDWEDVKLVIMYQIVFAKFSQNPELAEKLKNTGYAYLIEGNYWNDRYWGVCNGEGENHLGLILMHVRETLRCESLFRTNFFYRKSENV